MASLLAERETWYRNEIMGCCITSQSLTTCTRISLNVNLAVLFVLFLFGDDRFYDFTSAQNVSLFIHVSTMIPISKAVVNDLVVLYITFIILIDFRSRFCTDPIIITRFSVTPNSYVWPLVLWNQCGILVYVIHHFYFIIHNISCISPRFALCKSYYTDRAITVLYH